MASRHFTPMLLRRVGSLAPFAKNIGKPPLRHLKMASISPSRLNRYDDVLPPTRLQLRERLLESSPFELYPVVGVSFEGRQVLIEKLHREEVVAFVREPHNRFDANAVSVQNLSGESLGYISKEFNTRFVHPVAFGIVHSMGKGPNPPEGSGLWGFKVAAQPAVPGVTVLAVPDNLIAVVDLTDSLQGPRWDALKEETMSGKTCWLTGAPADRCDAQWDIDYDNNLLTLTEFRPVCEEVYEIERLLVRESSVVLKNYLRQMNGWRESELHRYLEHASLLQKEISLQPWRADLSYLQERGIPVDLQL